MFDLPAGVVQKTPPHFFTLHPTLFSKGNPVAKRRLIANVKANLAGGYPQIEPAKRKSAKPVIIVGGGPSARKTLPELRRLQAIGYKVVAAGSSHDWLIEQGVIPWAATCVDPIPAMARYYRRRHKDVRYLIASTCNPKVFQRLKGYQVEMWHADVGVSLSFANPRVMIHGGCTVVLRTINLLAALLGARKFHLFGFDGCADPETGDEHAYQERAPKDGALKDYRLGEAFFRVPGSLILQFYDWDGLLAIHGSDLQFMVHGGGLMSALHRERAILGL